MLAALGVAALASGFGVSSNAFAQPPWHSGFDQVTNMGNNAWNSFEGSNQATMRDHGRMMQSARDASNNFNRQARWTSSSR